MEIKLDVNTPKVQAVNGPQPAARSAKAAEPKVEFSNAAALDRALKATPDVRSEEVERARKLVNDTNWPPPETIQKLSTLFAMKAVAE